MGIFLVIAGAFCLLLACFPRVTWQLNVAWKYAKPENVEPSTAYLAVTSLTTGLIGVALIGLSILMASNPTPG
ncbi:MAG: hypothetical protein ACR2JG_05285 [Geodermatophilaceae bacterium]